MSNDDQFESIMSSQDIRRPSPVDVTAPGLQPVEKDDISAEASDKSSPGPSETASTEGSESSFSQKRRKGSDKKSVQPRRATSLDDASGRSGSAMRRSGPSTQGATASSSSRAPSRQTSRAESRKAGASRPRSGTTPARTARVSSGPPSRTPTAPPPKRAASVDRNSGSIVGGGYAAATASSAAAAVSSKRQPTPSGGRVKKNADKEKAATAAKEAQEEAAAASVAAITVNGRQLTKAEQEAARAMQQATVTRWVRTSLVLDTVLPAVWAKHDAAKDQLIVKKRRAGGRMVNLVLRPGDQVVLPAMPRPRQPGSNAPAGTSFDGIVLPGKILSLDSTSVSGDNANEGFEEANFGDSEPKVYDFGLTVGAGVTPELMDFLACFAPLAEENPAGEALRKEGFKSADPNGNGLCSLAELETFVLKTLVTKYPKTGKGKEMKEPGKDIFTAFRPSNLRAFSDAKDYKADTGAKIKGAKKATADDFVSVEEFRLFGAYLCIYAAMSDAFSKIDGGGAGRDANDDRRVDWAEFEAGYSGLADYGFLALTDIASVEDAKALFQAMDDNGGGIVLLDEWCAYLKATEVAASTPMGFLLNMDEEGGVGKQQTLPPVLKKPVRYEAEEAAAAAAAQTMVTVQTAIGKQRCRAGLLDKAFDSYFSEAEMRQHFLDAPGVAPEDLSTTTFKALVAKMCVEAGRASPPSEADLDAAFYIADLNNSGDIDMFEFVELYKQVQAGTLSGLGNSTQTTIALSQDRALSKAQEDWAARLERNNGGPTKPKSPKFQTTSKRPPKDKVVPIRGVPASYTPQQVLRVYLKRWRIDDEMSLFRLKKLGATDLDGLGLLDQSDLVSVGFGKNDAKRLVKIGQIVHVPSDKTNKEDEGAGDTPSKNTRGSASTQKRRSRSNSLDGISSSGGGGVGSGSSQVPLGRSLGAEQSHAKLNDSVGAGVQYKSQVEQIEAQRLNFRGLNSADLELNAEQYRLRPKITIPVAPKMTESTEAAVERKKKAEAEAAANPNSMFRVNKNDQKTYYETIRDWAGLSAGKEAYQKRVKTDSETGKAIPTKATGFAFKNTQASIEHRAEAARAKAVDQFIALDTDGNGTLSLRELMDGCSVLGINEITARELYDSMPKNADREIDRDMFLEHFMARPAGLEASVYGLDSKGNTQAEARDKHELDPGRRRMHAELTREKELYNARARDADTGKVKPTTGSGFSFWRSMERSRRKKKVEAQEKHSVSKEEVNSYYKQMRDWAGLSAAKESYGERMGSKEKGTRTTTGSMFNFFYTNERAKKKQEALEANPEKRAEYEARRTAREVGGTKEDEAKYYANMRRSTHQTLAEARAAYDSRARDADGNVAPTEQDAFKFATDERGIADRRPLAQGRQGMDTVGVADLQKHNYNLKAELSADALAARQAYEQRQRDEDGYLLPTEVQEFNMTQSTYVPRPATIYDGRAENNEQLAKREAQQRRELELILEQESNAYNERMGLSPSSATKDRDPSAFSRRVKSADEVAIDKDRESFSKVDFEKAKKNGREDASALLTAERDKFQARMKASGRRGSHTKGSTDDKQQFSVHEELKEEEAEEEEEEENEDGESGSEEEGSEEEGDEEDALEGLEEVEEGDEEEQKEEAKS